MHKLSESYKAIALMAPTGQTTTGTGTAVDLGIGYCDDLVVLLQTGPVGGTTPTCTMTIQVSTDNSNWVTGATFTALDAGSGNKLACAGIAMSGAYRYVRASYVIGGTTPNFSLGLILLARKQEGSSTVNSLTVA